MTENNGVLALNGQDLGPKVREFFHTDEYEYFYRVPAPYKNTLLLCLLKEKFEAGFVFNDWLDEHRIPYEFFNWYSPDEG